MSPINRLLTTALLLPAAYAATLTGRIVEDHSGSPAPSASVRVYKVGVRGLAADLETDGEGLFHAPGLPEGEYRIEVTKPGHLGTTLSIQLGAGEPSPLFIRLIRCGVIAGQVLDARGQPVPGAHVFAMPKLAGRPLRPEYAPGRYGTADARGRYRMFNLSPGEYLVALSYGASTLAVGSTGSPATVASLGSGVHFYPNNASPQSFTITGGEEFRNVDFAIFPSTLYSVSGKIDSPSAQPAQGRFWLALTAVDQPALAIAVTQAETSGTFRFEGVPPGQYHLFASGPSNARGSRGASLSPDALFARTRVDIGAQNVENISIAPEKGRSVTFQLRTDATNCSPAAQLILSPLEDWAAQLDRRTPIALAKEQTVSGLAPARYLVSTGGLGETCYGPDGLVLDLSTSTAPTTFTIPVHPAGAIHGRLDSSGRPATGFAIVLLPDATDPSRPVKVVFPDAQSRFTFGALRPGRYRIAAQPAAAKVQSRWLAERAPFVEVDVSASAPVEMTLAAPQADRALP